MTLHTEQAAVIGRAREIIELNNAYTRSKVLHSAVELGVFTTLAEAPATETELRAALGLHPRLARDFLDALVGLGLLEREDGRYHNSELAREHLVPGVAFFLGGVVARSASHHYRMWGRLTEALRDGKPKSEGLGGSNAFKEKYSDPNLIRQLLAHMDSYNSYTGVEIARTVDWSGYRDFVDAGGARGNVACQLVRRYPHLTGTVFELPPLEPYFEEHVRKHDLADQLSFAGGDFFSDPLPETDVVIIGHVLHDWPEQARAELLAKIFPSVRPGGCLLVYDQMLDDEHGDAHNSLASLNVRLVREGGSEYSAKECGQWAEKAGFTVREVIPLNTIAHDRLLVADKR
ncbi:methyltransferase [Nonomuraea sp. NPDC049158]|uniref:methyltransferase n=1 Tax=Nonomuraea sp. NPDC049158 TaxID=3155649 RepID=UPI0033CF5CA3